MQKIPRFIGLNFKMNRRLTPTIFVQSGFERMLVFPGISKADILGDVENPRFIGLNLKMNPRQAPGFPCNRVLKECLFSQGFQECISWAMLKIPHFAGPSLR